MSSVNKTEYNLRRYYTFGKIYYTPLGVCKLLGVNIWCCKNTTRCCNASVLLLKIKQRIIKKKITLKGTFFFFFKWKVINNIIYLCTQRYIIGD